MPHAVGDSRMKSFVEVLDNYEDPNMVDICMVNTNICHKRRLNE